MRRPAGRPPTGSRTSCSARPAPTSTTSGSPTRSRSTTRRSPRRSTWSARSSRTTKYVNGGLGDVKSIATTAFQDGGLPILDGKCALHRQAQLLRRQLARRDRTSPRTATCSPSTCRRSPRTSVAGALRRRVRDGVLRQAGGAGAPDLPVHRRLGEREGQGQPGRRLGQRQQGPGPGQPGQPDRPAVRADLPGPRASRSASTAPT